MLGNSLVMIVLNATIYLSLFGIFMDDLLILFGASSRTLPYAKEFMMYILPGMLVMNIMYLSLIHISLSFRTASKPTSTSSP